MFAQYRYKGNSVLRRLHDAILQLVAIFAVSGFVQLCEKKFLERRKKFHIVVGEKTSVEDSVRKMSDKKPSAKKTQAQPQRGIATGTTRGSMVDDIAAGGFVMTFFFG